MRLSFVLLLTSFNGVTSLLVAQGPNREQACLFSTKVGGRAAHPTLCKGDDPLRLAKDGDLAKVIRAFGIRPESILFTGCEGGVFSTAEDQFSGSSGATNRYVITYPSGVKSDFLAPITHELAHVLQIEMVGSLERLKDRMESKRIELGADFLTGIAFSHFLEQARLGEFQHNLSLIGLYRDSSSEAHGSPMERTAAFRRGVFFTFASVSENFRRASQEFQANIYGEIITIP
jgi:hypothetical protein